MTNLHSIISRKIQPLLAVRLYHIGRATSVHSAIHLGLLKSNGAAFRGKARPDPDDPREKYKRKHGLPDYVAPPRRKGFEPRRGKYKKENNGKVQSLLPRQNRGSTPRGDPQGSYRSRLTPSDSAREKSPYRFSQRDTTESLRRTMKDEMVREVGFFKPKFDGPGSASVSLNHNTNGRSFNAEKYPWKLSRDAPSRHSPVSLIEKTHTQNRPFPSHSKHLEATPLAQFKIKRETALDSESASSDRDKSFEPTAYRRGLGRVLRHHFDPRKVAGQDESSFPHISRPFEKKPQEVNPTREAYDHHESRELRQISRHIESTHRSRNDAPYPFFSNTMPISIPYTTPASEFLYGTSVIQAALESRKEPRRQLYKLYIYEGANREVADRDERLEQLANSRKVEVVRVNNSWIRILDKMSSGRPHNGYILEASPLPRLPVTGLWSVTSQKDADGNEQAGFEVEVDEQSREEAAINGSSNFVHIGKMPKQQPLVLLLDSIVDPGNLGGIIRTATFFGVSAIAVSIRNSAPFTPVVLKASAGASEFTPLLSVKSPTEFIVNSKKAGWRVYAAVAPYGKSRSGMHVAISSDKLATTKKLIDSPAILVIGGEGTGLRQSLRNKADEEVYISGRQVLGIDSLNVNVATGILCNAFLGGIDKSNNLAGQATDGQLPFQGNEETHNNTMPGDVPATEGATKADVEELLF